MTSPPPSKKVVIKASDIPEHMQQEAINVAISALEKHKILRDVAAFIKTEFDRKYSPTWHCVVGRSFGSYVTYETRRFTYFYVGPAAVLLFKAG
ncbi:dynein light chain 1, cytoplasmic-like [Ixodes scapularis]|uniref:Dynein light chain n=1 Tax=Ixodes scapularis TaxID=6945 RepID=B7QJH3_IXOSC|nr:dynein light chain 1, cytoplasmic-like [Ixodes scapularis]EEC18995.1 dynein light chain, putative [Ixodes scapularis]|eukprot:XP_002415330.1 dynein light chain, putative [Ixodes scapularis]